MTAEDLREMSFQNVLDQVLKPAGVQVGGYPEEMFTDLNDEEKEKWICNICYHMVRDARECDNKHLFCHTCVFAWSLTYGENSQKCPMCRSLQRAYPPNKEVDKLLKDKRVKCPEASCTFRSPLGVFLMHSHGRQRFVNEQVDLESLRPTRPTHLSEQVIILPGIAIPGMVRAANIREQLQEGRAMIHQMMLLLHLEMQLRQQALVSYSQAQDPNTRLRRLDEVLSLNEQLNEVGTILSALLSGPLTNRVSQARLPTQGPTLGEATPRRVDVSANVMLARASTGTSTTTTSTTPSREVLLTRGPTSQRHVPIQQLRATPPSPGSDEEDEEEEDDGDSSDSETTSVSSVGSVVPRIRMSMNGQLNSPRDVATSTRSTEGSLNRPMRRSEIRSQILSISPREATTPRLTRREIGASTSSTTQNSGEHVSIQRLESRGPGFTPRSDPNQSTSDHGSSSLPPLATSNTVNRQNGFSRLRNSGNGGVVPSSQTGASSGPSPRSCQTLRQSGGGGVVPSGSSMHQRILQSLNTESGDEEEDDDGDVFEDGTLDTARPTSSIQRQNPVANSVARRTLAPISGAPSTSGAPRSLTVTSHGVTASGATFQTSADTPSTRAAAGSMPASPNTQPAANARTNPNNEGPQVTASGALVSVTSDTPDSRTPSHVPESSLDTRAATSDTGGAGSSEVRTSSMTLTGREPAATQANFSDAHSSRLSSTTEQISVDDLSVSDSIQERPLSRSYAPQRRFRRETGTTGYPLPTFSSNRHHSRSVTVPSSSQVPYVPHRTSVSPTRNVRNITRRRSNSTSVEAEGRRSSFSRDHPSESVVRMAARGGNPPARNVLPQTPGQLLRARRRSDNRRPDNGPGGTI